jgi:hypothetical protein
MRRYCWMTALTAVPACVPLVRASAQARNPKNLLTAQPLSLIFETFSAEYERMLRGARTWGVAGRIGPAPVATDASSMGRSM